MRHKDVSKHLGIFISFPTIKKIFFAILILEIIISGILLVSLPVFKNIPQLLFLIFTPSIYSFTIHRLFFNDDNVLTLRRMFALQLFQEILQSGFILLGFLIMFFSKSYDIILDLIPIGVSISSLISFLVLMGFSKIIVSVTFGISVLYILLQSSRWIIIDLILARYVTMLVLILSFLVEVFMVLALIITWGEQYFSPFKMFRAYLEYYLAGSKELLENMFEEMFEKRDVALSVLGFISEKENLLYITGLNIHFGPFGTVGSGPLPSQLVKDLEKEIGGKIVLLRFLSDHSLDVSSEKEIGKIKEGIIRALSHTSPVKNYLSKFSQKESEGYCVTGIRIGQYCIIILSCPGHSVEDFPEDWISKFSDISNKHGLTTLLVSDAHNSIDTSKWLINRPDENRFTMLLEEVLNDSKNDLNEGLEIGFSRINEAFPKDEVGPGGISTIVLNIGGENYALIIIDGNNMVKDLRNYIIRNLKNLANISAAEVLTTDTHFLTGLKRARKGYFPVGSKSSWESILDACYKSVNIAVGNLSAGKVETYVGEVKGVRVAGNLFKRIESYIEYAEKTVLASLAFLTFLTCLVVYLLP
ncbi:MAG: DUF2070 family protein [Thermoproteota archaeon]